MKLAVAAILLAGASAQVMHPFEDYTARSAPLSKTVTGFEKMSIDAERAHAERNQKVHGGYEFAKLNDVDIDIARHGSWAQIAGGRVWSHTFSSPNALSMAFTFDSYNMCEGCALFVSSEEEVAGAFIDQSWDGVFGTRHVRGNEVSLEVFVPNQVDTPVLHVSSVATAWRPMGEKAGTCNINAVCVERENTCEPGCVPTDRGCSIACTYFDQDASNDQWADETWFNEVRASGAMQTAGGSRYCSGSLINAESPSGNPVFLTAHHCIGASPGTDLILFNFRAENCTETNDTNGPTTDTVGGLSILHSDASIDDSYLEVRNTIPDSYNTYLAGFSATREPAPATVGIHNPSSSITKISHSDMETREDSWGGGGAQDHWRVDYWTEATTEPGSSGSPLYNRETRRIVGQLHGGSAACPAQNGYDSYGAVWAAYDDGARDFLGPNREVDGQEAREFYRKRMQALN